MEEQFKHWIGLLANVIEAGAALVVLLAALEAALSVAAAFTHRRDEELYQDRLRIRLGRWLVVALEFELAADILLTAVSPTWDEIGKLAAIIVLRTVLNYFLQKEIEHHETRRDKDRPEVGDRP